MEEIKTLKEQAIDHLSATEGKELDLTCNLSSPAQMQIILEAEAHAILGNEFILRYTERMLRLTNSYMARHRQDIVEISKSTRFEQE